MRVTIEIPDDIARELAAENGAGALSDLPRALLQMVALEGYRSGELTHAQVGRLLGVDYRFDVDAFLKEHGAYLDYTEDDLERDRETARKLGLR